MLDQLYFTWSDIGLGGITGFRVRAASDGISDIASERYNSFKPYLNYRLPQGTDAYTATKEGSPYSLIFADTGKERVLTQQVYIGKDGYNRPGVYFIHLIAGLAEDFLACDAIDLWRSTSLWDTDTSRMRDPNSVRLDPILPIVLHQKKGSLSERAIANVQQYLPLLIQAYLTLGDSQKLYIAAPNEHIAALMWGLAHSLPRALQASLTFSIYEFDVLKAPGRVIGTSQTESELLKSPNRSAQILPPECYSTKGIGIDCYSGKTSNLNYVSPEIVDYSLYATDRFVKQCKKDVDELLATAEQLEVKNIDEFLAVCKFYASIAQSKALTKQEVTGLLSNQKLVTAILHRENVQQAIIGLAIGDPTWWDEQAAPALVKLRPAFANSTDKEGIKAREALTAFGSQVAADLCNAMIQNKVKPLEILMRILYVTTPPDKDVIPWIQVLRYFSEYMAHDNNFRPAEAFPWETRSWFLQQWAYGSQNIPIELIRPWLQFKWIEFAEFVVMPTIPNPWRQLGLIEFVAYSTEPFPKTIVNLFDNPKYQVMCENVLKELMRSAQTQPAVLSCFSTLVDLGYAQKISLLVALLNVNVASSKDLLSPEGLNGFLKAAKLHDKEKIELIEKYGSLLLPPNRKAEVSSMVIHMVTVYLSKLSLDKLLGRSRQITLRTLDLLAEQRNKFPPKVIGQIEDWLFISYGIPREPFVRLLLEKKHLKGMCEVIAHFKLQNDKKYRDSLFLILVRNIRTKEDLVLVLESFTPTLVGTQKDLLYELSAFVGERYPGIAHAYLLPYLVEILSQSLSMQSQTAKEKFLAPFLKALLQNANEETFRKIEGEINGWPKAYREEWKQYALAPKKGIWQRMGGNFIGGRKVGGNLTNIGRGDDNYRVPSGQLPNPPAAQPQDQSPQQKAQEKSKEPPQQQNGGISASQNQYMDASPNIPSFQHPQGAQYTPPSNAQQQGGYQALRPPNQNPPHQEFTSDVPYAPNNVPAPQPQSMVNGKPIYPKQILAVFTLKGPYIKYRLSELNDLFNKAKKDTKWILEEKDELYYHSQMWHTLEALEHDILINDTFGHYGLDCTKLLEEVYKKVKGEYKKKFGDQYSDAEIKNVLLVFVRYRLLEEYLREQKSSIKDWLVKQRSNAVINRSPMPLPEIK